MRPAAWPAAFVGLLAIALSPLSRAQDVAPADFADWAARNDYAPGRDWRSYLLIAPGNMGPNALPMPPTVTGRVDTAITLSLAGSAHYAPGDRASDLTLAAAYPFGRRASLRVRYTLREWYRYDAAVALERNALRPAGAYSAAGDVWVEGVFQVLRQRARRPDVALAARIKTASGGDLEGLRYTDSPGYWFDVSAGKDVRLGAAGAWTLRPYASAGFFVWQRFGEDSPQNDAFTYAAGTRAECGPLSVWAEGAGYVGYTGRLDQPLVLRGGGGVALGQQWRLEARLAHGLHDWAYTSLSLAGRSALGKARQP